MTRVVSSLALLAALSGTLRVCAQQPSPPPIQQAGFRHPAPARDCDTKVCAVEMKATTKVVHGSVCKDYCQPHSCLSDLWRACFGSNCRECDCGTVKTYRVLTKKVVPGPDVPVCRVKDLAICPSPAVPQVIPEIKKAP